MSIDNLLCVIVGLYDRPPVPYTLLSIRHMARRVKNTTARCRRQRSLLSEARGYVVTDCLLLRYGLMTVMRLIRMVALNVIITAMDDVAESLPKRRWYATYADIARVVCLPVIGEWRREVVEHGHGVTGAANIAMTRRLLPLFTLMPLGLLSVGRQSERRCYTSYLL